MERIFKDVLGYENEYQVSNYAEVINKRTGKIKKEQINNNGYKTIILWKDGKPKNRTIHSLVWEAFNGPVPEGYEINHKDERPENNRFDNLNLLTHKQNMNWGTVNERLSKSQKGRKATEETKAKMSKSHIGKLVNHSGTSKRVLQYTLDGDFVREYPSTQEAVRQTGFSGGSIRECCNGKRKTCSGFKWKYLIIK